MGALRSSALRDSALRDSALRDSALRSSALDHASWKMAVLSSVWEKAPDEPLLSGPANHGANWREANDEDGYHAF